MRRFGLLGLGLLAMTAALTLPLAWGGLPALRSSLNFPQAGWGGVLLLAGVAALARATRQQLLLNRLDAAPRASLNLAASLATETAYALTPGSSGGLPASVWLLRRAGVPLSAALAVSAADPLLDALFFAVALPASALALTLEIDVRPLREAAWLASTLLVVALVVAWLLRRARGRWWSLRPAGCPRRWTRPSGRKTRRRTRVRSDRSSRRADTARSRVSA